MRPFPGPWWRVSRPNVTMIQQNYLFGRSVLPVCIKLSCVANRMHANEKRKGGYDREIRLMRGMWVWADIYICKTSPKFTLIHNKD